MSLIRSPISLIVEFKNKKNNKRHILFNFFFLRQQIGVWRDLDNQS